MSAIEDIEKLVQKTAQEALKDNSSLQFKIDALRAMGPYYSALKKIANKEVPESDEPTMGDLRRQLDAAEENGHGGARVQDRARSGN